MNIPPQSAEIVRSLWYKANLTLEDIGREVNRAASTVGHWGKVMGLGRRVRDSDWTPEREKQLAELWAEGLTATQVARAMGGLTRSAVLGKVHRLGLCGRAEVNKPGRPASPNRPKGNGRKRPFIFTMAPNRKRTEPVMATELAPELVGAFEPRWVPLLDLPPTLEAACRFPHAEEPLFCAHPRALGSRACEHHLPRMVSRVAKGL